MDAAFASKLLPPKDVAFLIERKFDCDLTKEGENVILTLHNFGLSGKYRPAAVELRIDFPPGYPDAKLDMFWVLPWVTLADGTAPPQTNDSPRTFADSNALWQRWSRHHNEWRPGVNSLRTFYNQIHNELVKGV